MVSDGGGVRLCPRIPVLTGGASMMNLTAFRATADPAVLDGDLPDTDYMAIPVSTTVLPDEFSSWDRIRLGQQLARTLGLFIGVSFRDGCYGVADTADSEVWIYPDGTYHW